MKKLSEIWAKYKYPLIVLLVGILILLMPTDGKTDTNQNSELKFEELLCSTRGVGKARVIISDKGVVVACEGADSARVRLDIFRSIASYTGFASDKVTILKLEQ